MTRDGRFVTSSRELRAVGLASFFKGDLHVKERMDQVREAIVDIRTNWARYHAYSNELRAQLDEVRAALLVKPGVEEAEVTLLDTRLSSVFGAPREWCDRPGARSDASPNYDALRIYTSDLGYGLFQQMAKSVFRKVPTPNRTELITAAFLVELINIDLYNYVAAEPQFRNFEGVVYRGINLDPEDFEVLAAAANHPDLRERYFSIPLGLDSSSRSPERARRFLTDDGTTVPALLKVHVCGLGDGLMEPYRKAHPSSVVSTICATDVHRVSDRSEEQEVLLRGPFYQLLRVGMQDVAGMRCYVVEAVMLNSNRDHFSTPQTGANDEARQLFGTLAALRRNAFCRDFCRDAGLTEDRDAYEKALAATRSTFTRLTGQASPV